MFRRLSSMVVGVWLGAVACGEDRGDDEPVCMPGTQLPCTCAGGAAGSQVCAFDGSGWDFCQCGGGPGTTGADAGTDSGGDVATSDGSGTGDDTGTGDTAGGACSSNATFAMLIPNMTSVWQSGMLTGLGAGHELCQAMGADHVCDYEEVLAAEAAGELADVAAGTTAWLHRTSPADGSAAGPGGRCVEWTYGSNELADGEFVQFGAGGTVTYNLDDDTTYDPMAPEPNPHVQVGLLECGGVTRAIMCCNECLDG